MKALVGKIIILPFLVLGLSACAIGPTKQAKTDIRTFANSMRIVTSLFSEQMKATELAHQAALKENTFLQFDLGGNPPVSETSLFSYREYAARDSIVVALQSYAHNLEQVFLEAEKDPASLLSVEFNEFDPDFMDLSHGLDEDEKAALIGTLEGVAKVAFSSFANAKVGDIVQKYHPAVERAALLLYLDLGSTEDQADSCPIQDAFRPIKLEKSQIRLCRGGLRSIHLRANHEQLKTQRLRLQLLPTLKRKAADRGKVIDLLYKTRKAGKLMDKAMGQTQQALLKLIAAHRHLRNQYGTEKSAIEDVLPNWFAKETGTLPMKTLSEITNFLPGLLKGGQKLLEN